MAASSGLGAAALVGNVGPPPVAQPTATTDTASTKALQTLMTEIDALKSQIESETKRLEKIDLSKKKVDENRAEAVQGRTGIQVFRQRIDDLDRQVKATTKDKDPNQRTFDKTKKNAEKTFANLRRKLDQADKHLEKAGPAQPITTVSSTATPEKPAETAENTKGVGGLISRLSFRKKKSESKQSLNETPTKTDDEKSAVAPETSKAEEKKDDDEEEEEEEENDDDDDDVESGGGDDDDVISDKGKEPVKPRQPIAPERKKVEVKDVESENSEEDSENDDEDDASDRRGLLNALESRVTPPQVTKDTPVDGRRSKSPTTPRTPRKPPTIKVDRPPSASPKPKKTTLVVPPPAVPSRKKTPSPKRTVPQKEESDEDSYFEEEAEEDEEEGDDDDEELQNLHDSREQEEAESEHDYDDAEVVNSQVQALREAQFSPGAQFVAIADFAGAQTGDLSVRNGDILTLVEQRSDDWWLFSNAATKAQGLVPINYIKNLTRQHLQRRMKPSTSASTLVDAFKKNGNIPLGFVPSDLSPLAEMKEYKIWRTLVPKMTDSNLAYADLIWDPTKDKIDIHDVNCQRILTIKECIKIPRAKGEQIRVLDRCVRICLYDGFEIVSNIQTVRANIPRNIDSNETTENWFFADNNIETRIDDQSQFLIRSDLKISNKKLYLLIELSQWCQSTVTEEKCEVACGWCMTPLDDDEPPLLTDTKNYNLVLNGGHTDEPNVLLCPEYKILRSNGISGMIDRFKLARVKFSIESRDRDVDELYDNLPRQAMIVPLNLVRPLVFFRNELAYQLTKRPHPTGLSTTPLDSIFLSTFPQALDQPELIFILSRLYRRRKRDELSSSASIQQKCKLFVSIYEQYIYPLLHYRDLPPYEFHNHATLIERGKIIRDMISSQIKRGKAPPRDILSILLDPNSTHKWTPFTTNEISFTLQNSIPKYFPDTLA